MITIRSIRAAVCIVVGLAAVASAATVEPIALHGQDTPDGKLVEPRAIGVLDDGTVVFVCGELKLDANDKSLWYKRPDEPPRRWLAVGQPMPGENASRILEEIGWQQQPTVDGNAVAIQLGARHRNLAWVLPEERTRWIGAPGQPMAPTSSAGAADAMFGPGWAWDPDKTRVVEIGADSYTLYRVARIEGNRLESRAVITVAPIGETAKIVAADGQPAAGFNDEGVVYHKLDEPVGAGGSGLYFTGKIEGKVDGKVIMDNRMDGGLLWFAGPDGKVELLLKPKDTVRVGDLNLPVDRVQKVHVDDDGNVVVRVEVNNAKSPVILTGRVGQPIARFQTALYNRGPVPRSRGEEFTDLNAMMRFDHGWAIFYASIKTAKDPRGTRALYIGRLTGPFQQFEPPRVNMDEGLQASQLLMGPAFAAGPNKRGQAIWFTHNFPTKSAAANTRCGVFIVDPGGQSRPVFPDARWDFKAFDLEGDGWRVRQFDPIALDDDGTFVANFIANDTSQRPAVTAGGVYRIRP